MRWVLSVVAIALISATVCHSQQGSTNKNVDDLLAKLRSKDSAKRAQAYEQVKSDPETLRGQKVKAALMDLLERESERMRGVTTPDEQDSGEGGVGSEGFAEYFSELVETVGFFADWTDQHQACILVKSGTVPPSDSPKQAAIHEQAAWPCLRQMSGSRVLLDRANASRILIELSANAGNALNPAIAQGTRQIIVGALHDQDESVRGETTKSLEDFGTVEMIPALKQVAESDPAVDSVDHSRWIRERAAKAITAIQERAGQH